MRTFRHLLGIRPAATPIEYGLIAALVATLVLAGLSTASLDGDTALVLIDACLENPNAC